jgi:hypothetical protein
MTAFRGGIKSTPEGALGVVHTSPVVKTIEVELDTSGAATTVTGGFPAWSRLIAAVAKVTETVADVDATGFSMGIGGTTVLTGDLTVHPAMGGGIAWNPATSIETTATALDIRLTLTGGSDQTPSAGKITVDLVMETWK